MTSTTSPTTTHSLEEDQPPPQPPHKFFSRDAMPLIPKEELEANGGIPASPKFDRLFSRDVINVPSPTKLNRLFSRGAVEQTTPVMPHRTLVDDGSQFGPGGLARFVSMDEDYESVLPVLDLVQELGLKGQEEEEGVVVSRTLTLPAPECVAEEEYCQGMVFQVQVNERQIGRVEITKIHLNSSVEGHVITVRSTPDILARSLHHELEWPNTHILDGEKQCESIPLNRQGQVLIYLRASSKSLLMRPPSTTATDNLLPPAERCGLFTITQIGVEGADSPQLDETRFSAALLALDIKVHTVLWSPQLHFTRFPASFHRAAHALALCRVRLFPSFPLLTQRVLELVPFDWFE